MTELLHSSEREQPIKSQVKEDLKVCDWTANSSFGEGLQRGIILLRSQFRWLVAIFFVGGLILSLLIFPINMIIEVTLVQIMNEIFSPVPDWFLLFDLFISNLVLNLFSEFIIAFGIFILNTLAIYRVWMTNDSIHILAETDEAPKFPFIKVLVVAGITAVLIMLASVIPALPFIISALLFFVPALLIIGAAPPLISFRRSTHMRHRHWQRILGALILVLIFNIFAGTLGVTIYFNIETLFLMIGINLGLVGPILLFILTQLFVAMVAPILPLLSISFYSSAKTTSAEVRYRDHMRRARRQQLLHQRLIPFDDSQLSTLCIHCDARLKTNAKFCHQCGTQISMISENQ